MSSMSAIVRLCILVDGTPPMHVSGMSKARQSGMK